MASRSRRDKISAVDTAWLRMDRPHNLMMICGVLMFARARRLARLRKVIDERFLVFRRFRQRAGRDRPASAFWETDPQFDLDRHVVPTALPGQRGHDGAAGARVAAR